MILFTHRITIVLVLLLPLQHLRAETITVPIKIDFPLLQQLVESQLFTGKSNSTELLHDSTGCNEIILSEPKLREFNNHLIINSHLNAKLGVKLSGECVSLPSWDGHIQITSDLVIKEDSPRKIYLQIVDSHLITLKNEHLTSGTLWNQARKFIYPLMNQFHIDLTPSINELKSLLPFFLSKHSQSQINEMLSSLQLTHIQTTAEGIQSDISLEIETISQSEKPEHPLTEQEQEQWQKEWQSMDALLTYTVKHYAKETELQELRLTLFDILMDARYQLQNALQENHSDDPVRHWFINSWSQLIPVLEQISVENSKHAPLALITLITAADALQVLDKLGPTFGLDISIDGLRRLARMINNSPKIDPLQYNENLDSELLQLFQFNPANNISNQSSLNLWPINSAIAATNKPLNTWVPTLKELDDYLPKVKDLLLSSANQSLTKSTLTPQQKDVFKKMVMATAWQESCWRQYIIKQKKIAPISSSTGDTGIMQINENVWRGFVNRQKLRWDIAYNAQTGSNILLNYMTRYAIKKAEDKQQGGIENLARSTYSIYNGGPSQFSRYRHKKTTKTLKKVDNEFYDKYLKVKQGDELTVAQCLGQSKKSMASIKPKKKAASPLKKTVHQTYKATLVIHNKDWIKKQNKDYFALQLGVFSSHQAANTFINQQKVTGNYVLYQLQNKKNLYRVIYGYYSTYKKAKKESLLFTKTKPWIRQFKEF
ncbi:MAG: transglycosylase SLT domain-containing protein [Methylococcales bacterium]|nr:transglycosylase SLT domain-containing protein [Methylococcales bacterium]